MGEEEKERGRNFRENHRPEVEFRPSKKEHYQPDSRRYGHRVETLKEQREASISKPLGSSYHWPGEPRGCSASSSYGPMLPTLNTKVAQYHTELETNPVSSFGQ